MFTVYVLKSASLGKRYVGSTGNLQARLRLHNQGKVRATKGGTSLDIDLQRSLRDK